MSHRAACVAIGWARLTGVVAAMGQDAPRSADHPLVGRLNGSVIRTQTRQEFSGYVLPLGPPDKSERRFQAQQEIEGKVTKTMYEAPAGSSSLAVFRSYQTALQRAGFATMYSCSGRQCSADGRIQYTIKNTRPADYIRDLGGHSLDDEDAYLLAAHEPKKDVYAIVYATHIYADATRVVYFTDVIETKPLASGTSLILLAANLGQFSSAS